MREIEFRGKRVDNEEWVYGYYAVFTGKNIIYVDWKAYEVMPKSVGQFTGLLDKNGNKIFEGDIIKQRYFPIGANEKAVEYYREGVIDYQNNCFGVIWKIDGLNILNKDLASYRHKEKREIYKHPSQGVNWFEKTINNIRVEIIGNIHEENK